jgi:hypothetical protein
MKHRQEKYNGQKSNKSQTTKWQQVKEKKKRERTVTSNSHQVSQFIGNLA